MQNIVREFIAKHKLKLDNANVCVAVSTGVDSSVLTDVLLKLQSEFNYKLVLCHVNHHVRDESDAEEEYIGNYARKNKLLLEVCSIPKDIRKANFEAKARCIRLDFYRKAMNKYHAEYIFLGHHLNDDIETSVMRIIKGSSIGASCGIKEVTPIGNDQYMLRPFLKCLKKDIVKYANENKIKYFTDETNDNDSYFRNRVRHKIVPLLFGENNNFQNAYLHYKDFMFHAADLIAKERDGFLKHNIKEEGKRIKFSLPTFLALDAYMQKEMLFCLLQDEKPSLASVEDAIKMLKSRLPNRKTKIGKTNIHKAYDEVYLLQEEKKDMPHVVIDTAKEYAVNSEYILSVRRFTADDATKNKNLLTNLNTVWYNNEKLPLTLRTRQSKDWMMQACGKKKVKDILIDLKVPLFMRDETLLLASGSEVLIIFGYKKSSALKLTEDNNILIELRERQT